jgi:Divergent InlB B-repeat domain
MTSLILQSVRNKSTLGGHLVGVPLLLVLVSCTGPTGPDDERIERPSVSMDVVGSGNGSGHVAGGPPATPFDCHIRGGVASAPGCSRSFQPLETSSVSLTASPDLGSTFVGWSGCSTVVGTTCRLSYSRDKSESLKVTATFAAASTGLCNDPENFPLAADFESVSPFTRTVDATGGATTDATRLETGGAAGGGYLRMAHMLPSPSSILVSYLHPTVYSPAAGAITRIEYREDRIQFDPPFNGAAIGGGFFLLQSGVRHLIPLTDGVFTHLNWQTATAVLTPADFPAANLTAQGGPIQFGFYRNNSANPNGPAITTAHGIDNWEVRVCR